MSRLKNLFLMEYNDSSTEAKDRGWYKIENALEILSDSTDTSEASAARASLAVSLSEILKQSSWASEYHMLFAESWRSLPSSVQADILYVLSPLLAFSDVSPCALWYIDSMCDGELYALLHLSFVETGLRAVNSEMRAYAVYALVKIPNGYWAVSGQQEHFKKLCDMVKNDPSSMVRNELRLL